MKTKLLVAILCVFLLFGCRPKPNQSILTTPTTGISIPMKTQKISTSSTIVSTPSSDTYVDLVDLTKFAATWSTHDAAAIRTLYIDGARYFTEGEVQKLANDGPVDVLVSENAFQQPVNKFAGYKMRILGKPIGIYDKLVAFAYRWEESDKSGYNGVALLRFEGGKILLHIDVISPEKTPWSEDETVYMSSVDLSSLMNAWNNADISAGHNLYSEHAVILSDEDLAQTPWRDYIHPPQLKDIFNQFKGWNPVVLGQPLQINNLVIFAWRWDRSAMNYPVGYGVRLLKLKDSLITTDIRFAVRPWEAQGNSFLNP